MSGEPACACVCACDTFALSVQSLVHRGCSPWHMGLQAHGVARTVSSQCTMHGIEPLAVLDFFVAPGHQRQGHGIHLFRHMLARERTSLPQLGWFQWQRDPGGQSSRCLNEPCMRIALGIPNREGDCKSWRCEWASLRACALLSARASFRAPCALLPSSC